MAHTRPKNAKLATHVWQLMFDFLIFTSPARQESLERRGLTPNDNRALSSLDEDNGRPIGALASQWGCDPSNATFIIDRLEKAGLAKRQAAESDRRVKLVVLTRLGARTRAELLAEFHMPPPELAGLPAADLETLERILEQLGSRMGNTIAYGALTKPSSKGATKKS
jgi:DNA-binding MarR family transcriptional regulator